MSLASPRRRNRPITACLECRRRRRKCDRNEPCRNCLSSGLQCVFVSGPAENRLAEYKRQLTKSEELLLPPAPVVDPSLELEKSYGLRTLLSRPVAKCRWPEVIASEELPPAKWEQGIQPWQMTTGVMSVRCTAVEASDLASMRVGRMFLTTRTAGFYRLQLSEEVSNFFMSIFFPFECD